MNQFRDVRDAIRRLGPDDCFGITRAVFLSKKGGMYMNREVFFAKKRGWFMGKVYQRIKYPVSNWRKRLAILSKVQNG